MRNTVLIIAISSLIIGAFVYALTDITHSYVRWGDNTIDTSEEAYVLFSPTNDPGNRVVMAKMRFDSTFRFYFRDVFFNYLDSTRNAGQPTSLLWLANNGLTRRTPFSSVLFPFSQVTGATTSGITEGTNLYYTNARARLSLTAGTGIGYNSSTGVITNSSPDQTLSLTSGQGVTVSGAYPSFTVSTAKRPAETYLGNTDASGNYTVTYSTAYSSIPDVQPQLQAGTASQVVRITSSTTGAFTVNVTNRASVNIAGIEVLLAATTPVSGASVSVLVTSR